MAHIDRRLLDTPVAAAGATLRELSRMARVCRGLVRGATDAVLRPHEVDTEPLWAEDDAVDQLQESITSYLVELMEHDIPDDVSAQVPALLHVANDFERVGDHCKNLLEIAENRQQEDMPWSDAAHADIAEMASIVDRMLVAAADALAGENGDLPARILEDEQLVDRMTEEGRRAHLSRAREGECLMLPGVLYLDALMNYEKIGDHIRNVARALEGGLMDAGARLPYEEEEGVTAADPRDVAT